MCTNSITLMSSVGRKSEKRVLDPCVCVCVCVCVCLSLSLSLSLSLPPSLSVCGVCVCVFFTTHTRRSKRQVSLPPPRFLPPPLSPCAWTLNQFTCTWRCATHAPQIIRAAEKGGVQERGGGRGQNLGEFEAELLCGFGVGADGAGIPDAVICDFFF